jgi:tRNA (cmo5U34)-methyltransferase
MLQVASGKLKDVQHAAYINSNFYDFNFDKKYDAVVSSLALHHLVTKEDKLDFYRKIYSCLNTGGVFINADVVLASTDALQERYMEQWKSFMRSNVPKDEVDNKWIPTYYEEDTPISIMEHFDMLKDAGFEIMDVVWKYYNFAVYMAVK